MSTMCPNAPLMNSSSPRIRSGDSVTSMTVLLVNPACLDPRITDGDALLVPMGLFYIAALLNENRIQTRVVNLAVEQNPLDHLKSRVMAERPRIVGFSVLNANRFSAMEGAKIVKAVDPEITVVFGGPCATFLCDHLFERCPELDYVVKGEGEITFLELAEHVRTGEKRQPAMVQGLALRDGQNRIVHTPGRSPIEDLDSLPMPGRYFDFQHVSLSRGCPGHCTFCGSPRFWPGARVRFHSPGWFVEQLSLLVERGITHFFVSDDTFTMDKTRVIQVCRLIIEQGLPITWVAISRADFIDSEILLWMRRAGCTQISFGVESGSADIRKRLGKPMDRQQIIQAFALTVSYGIMPRAYFIYGSPGETDETVQESLDLIRDLRPLSAIFYLLVLFPGTRLYQRLVDQGRLSDQMWSQKIEDLPWFETDPDLDFDRVKGFGHRLRMGFYSGLSDFAAGIELVDEKRLYPLHADFLSRLAMTFSHGEYAQNPWVKNPMDTAQLLFERALAYHPDHRAFLGLAMLFQKLRQFDSAVDAAMAGLRHFKSSRDLNICMAVGLMNLGRFQEALVFLEPFKADPEVKVYVDACIGRI